MKDKKKWRLAVIIICSLLVLLVILSLGIAACSKEEDNKNMPPVASGSVIVTPGATVPNDKPSLRGYITRINHAAESTEIMVEYFAPKNGEPEFTNDKAVVKLDGNTAIASDGDSLMSLSSLSVGMLVEVWFSEPSMESYPILAYGQAVKVITNATSITGVKVLPQLTVVGTSNSLAGVMNASWKGREYDFYTLTDMLDSMLGAHLSSSPGNTLALNFSVPPDKIEVTCSNKSFIKGEPLEVVEPYQITLPEDVSGEVFINVRADWANGSVWYAFSVTLIQPQI